MVIKFDFHQKYTKKIRVGISYLITSEVVVICLDFLIFDGIASIN